MEVLMRYQNEKYVDSPSSLSDYQPQISEEDEYMTTNVSEKVYERSRIKALADERENVQKKTFSKWINSQLVDLGISIQDMYMDLRDGKVLLNLLEILSNEVVPKPTRGRMRIHCLENVDKCLGFLYDQRVHLENVGAHDIVDGNNRLTLGLIWTIILRFQVQDIMLDDFNYITPVTTTNLNKSRSKLSHTQSVPNQDTAALSAKSALLLWCQMKTAGYPNINIHNFTTSWRNGLGFLAIIHKHRPDLVDYSQCLHQDNLINLQMAFDIAEKELGIVALLDAEDVNVQLPDEKSLITYIASYYHYFSSMKLTSVLNKRLNKLLNQCIDDESMEQLYDNLVTNLLSWIMQTIELLNDRQFANSVSGLQQQMSTFAVYRTNEKPGKFKEKADIEVLLFTINSNLRAAHKRCFTPSESISLNTINAAWEKLNKAEYGRELALRTELVRQEKLRNLAQRFMKKAMLRKTWINDNLDLLSKQSLGNDYTTILAALKKHEAIETDIYAFENNIQSLNVIADNLAEEVYNDMVTISAEKNQVLELWKKLLETINNRREHLDNFSQLYRMLNDFDDIQRDMLNTQQKLITDNYGQHLWEVEEMLRSHELIESDLKWINQRVEKLIDECNRYLKYSEKDFKGNSNNNSMVLQKKHQIVEDSETLYCNCEERKAGLLHSQLVWQYIGDIGVEEQWMKDILNLLNNPELGQDLTSVDRTMKKHKLLEMEINSKRQELEEKLLEGKSIADESEIGFDVIVAKNRTLQHLWENLIDVTEARKLRIMELLDFYQFLSDCDDLLGWIIDFRRLFELGCVGDKMSQTELLIRRNQENMKLVESKREGVEALKSEANVLMDFTSIDVDSVRVVMENVESQYNDLLKLSHSLQEKLLDELTVYRLLNDADSVRSWISEKQKFLVNFVPTDDIEELEMLKHRFENFESELTKRAEKVYHVNNLSETLVSSGSNTNFKIIVDNQDNLNEEWNKMADVIDAKRDNLLAKYHCNNFTFDCQQTIEWIQEKIDIINKLTDPNTTNNNEDDDEDALENLMAIQRRLNHIQRDMCAIEAKIDHLDNQGDLIIRSNLADKATIESKLGNVHKYWNDLNKLVAEKEGGLMGKNDVHKLLLMIEEIQIWIGKMQTNMAEQNIPESIKEVEKMLIEYNMDRSEIENMEAEKDNLLKCGRDYLAKKELKTIQNSLLLQRLDGLDRGWQTMIELAIGKECLLREYSKSLMFFEDAKEIEKVLNTQENFLTRDAYSSNLLSLHEAVTDQEDFVNKMENDKNVLTQVLSDGKQLIDEGNYQKDKIQLKCQLLEERWNKNLQAAKMRKDNIRDRLKLFELLQDIEDLDDSLMEKNNTLNQFNNYTNKSKASMLAQCRALEGEVKAQQPKIYELTNRAEAMMKECNEYATEIEPVLENMNSSWNEFMKTLEEKLHMLSTSDREAVLEENTQTVIDFLQTLESQIISDDETDGGDMEGMSKVNDRLQKLNQKNAELQNKSKLIDELKVHSDALKDSDPIKAEQFEQIQQEVRVKLNKMSTPLSDKRDAVDRAKVGIGFVRDCAEEIDWSKEKMDSLERRLQMLDNKNLRICSTLQTCQQIDRWLKAFVGGELESRRPRYEELVKTGENLLQNHHPKSTQIKQSLHDLQACWATLVHDGIDKLRKRLDQEKSVQEYLLDVTESGSWISEKELQLVSIKLDKKDESLIGRTKRKHKMISEEINNYSRVVEELRFRCNKLAGENFNSIQEDLEKNYAALTLLDNEKEMELSNFIVYCDSYDLYKDLELWILERTKIARDDSSGRDLDECSALREKFTQFSQDTNKIGGARLDVADRQFNILILSKHPFSHSISKWKDRINEIWADLLELIDTRIQLLKSAWDLHKWYCDCQAILEVIEEKRMSILTINQLGRDLKSVNILQRMLKNFEKELSRLDSEINGTIAVSDTLLPLYCKEKEAGLVQKRNELIEAFKRLRQLLEEHQLNNIELADYHNLMAMIRELNLWITTLDAQMTAVQRPSDVSGIELLLSNHRSMKTGIDSKEENFSICLNLGRTLLRSKHVKSAEIKSEIKELSDRRDRLCTKWYRLLDELSLMVEVYRWARDAAIAESWLSTQESFLKQQQETGQQEYGGSTLEETLTLLKRHILFQKSQENHEEKFEQLKRLTTLEMRARQLSPEHNQLQDESYLARHKAHELEDHLILNTTLSDRDSMISPIQMEKANQQQHKSLYKDSVLTGHQSTLKRSGSVDSSLDTDMTERKESLRQQNKQPSYRKDNRPATSRILGQNQSATIPDIHNQISGPVSKRPVPSNALVNTNVYSPLSNMSVSSDTLSTAAPSDVRNTTRTGPRPEDIKIRGPLYRKHQWNNKGQKAGNRSWKSLYVEILNSRLHFFKDERHYKQRPGQLYKNEMPLPLRDVVAAPAQDYYKRPCVFRLRFRNAGTEYLFQAGSIVDMTRWIEAINAACTNTSIGNVAAPPPSSAQSHPNLSSSGRNNNSNNNNEQHQPSKGLKRFFSSIRLKK